MYIRKMPINPYDKVIRWSWYKAWTMAIFRPSIKTGEVLLQEGNITVRQVITWNGVAGLIFGLLLTLRNIDLQASLISSTRDAIEFILVGLIIVVVFEIGILIYTNFVDRLAALLKRKGSFVASYILYGTIISPVLLLFGIILLFSKIFIVSSTDVYLYLCLILGFYGILILLPLPAMVVYRFNWLAALLVTVVVPITIFFACSLSCILTFPSRE